MKIVVAMDSFKESLTAQQACEIVAGAIASVKPDIDIVIKPMADGGEGTAKAMLASRRGEWIPVTVMGPLPHMQVDAGFAWFNADKTALVEMATASGLELLTHQQRNPLLTTTYGTGQLIAAAKEYGAAKIYLAIGGSATVDAGTGAAAALGWKFTDDHGNELPLGGGQLNRIARIIPPSADLSVPLEVLCDVDNPLCGPSGAARVYAPQKGADAQMVDQLEAGMKNLAKLIKQQLNRQIKDTPGTGAAGGLAAGAIAFMNATLTPGIDFIIAYSNIKNALTNADWLITGEGRFDHQSLRGKVIAGLAKAAKKTNTKVAVLAGQIQLKKNEYQEAGITQALPCMNNQMTLQHAIENAEDLLKTTAQQFAANNL